MYALCVSGAVNTQGFVWKVFMRYIYKFFIHSFTLKSERTPSRHHIGRNLNPEKYLELQLGVQTLGAMTVKGTRGTML